MRKPSFVYRIFILIIILSQLSVFFPTTLVAAQNSEMEPQSLVSKLQSPATEPQSANATLDNSLSISRVQSSYLAGTSTITFTLTNNLYPTLYPDTSASATVTDTVDILASFVITDDANTLQNVTLENTLANGTALLAASDDLSQNGNDLIWSLADLPPQGSASITMTVQTLAEGSDFIDLDTGAQVQAARWGDPISATARPAVIVPAGIDPTALDATPDADIFDTDMLWKTGDFAQEPLEMFAYVQGFDYDPYRGSLRGTRGTLWGEAGNSVDRTSLLIAMLRAAGVPARYRHGTLDTANAQALLAGMFPVPSGVAGYLPAGTETADPLNDPDLLVTCRITGGWRPICPVRAGPTSIPASVAPR